MIIINIIGLLLMVLIVWWFWFYKSKEIVVGAGNLIITVANGTYSPSHLKVPAGQPVAIQFVRKDPSPCAETVQIPDLQIIETLPLNQVKTLYLPAMPAGEYPFHCQMQMYRGQIHVVEENLS